MAHQDNDRTSQTEFFAEPITILRTPSWLGSQVHEDREQPLAPGAWWTVTCVKTNATI
ncbi:hypothetical protein [Variovorax sp. OV700]|uniref:hypothetical protein n=1 Tax=Variovorax sp. OV700 TaxID=1882826 RepID=UPI0020C8A77F|nr:hypothetical protein [Variovorax sp. OV700]